MTSLLTNARRFLKPHDICFLSEDLHRFFRDNQTKRQSGEVAEWLKAADCKSARVAYVGSNPTLTTIAIPISLVGGGCLFQTKAARRYPGARHGAAAVARQAR